MKSVFYSSSILLATLAGTTALSAVKKVVVTGAGGQTGKSLFRQLLGDDDFRPIGIVRTQSSKEALLEYLETTTDDAVVDVVVCDVTDPAAVEGALDWESVDALCICTSATPKPTGDTTEQGRPVFAYPQDPEIVDWIGQKSQIDALAAAASGKSVSVVICSSMGGSDPENFLNTVGRTTDPETGKETGGNILMWKRKSERYLIDTASGHPGLAYTIVHPGGLINEPGSQRELIVGVDDDRVAYGGEESPRTVPRDDVARVMMEACRNPKAFGNRSFDLRAFEPAAEGGVETDFSRLLDPLEGKNTDYALGKSM